MKKYILSLIFMFSLIFSQGWIQSQVIERKFNQAVENYGKRRWRRYQPSFHFDIDSSPDIVQTFCNDILKIIVDNSQTTNEKSSWACVEALGPQSIDVNINMYWDISSGKTEREAREVFLLSVMKLAGTLGLNFYEPRVRRQYSN